MAIAASVTPGPQLHVLMLSSRERFRLKPPELLPVSELIECLPHCAAGRISRVVVFRNLPGSLSYVAGKFRCLLASFGVRGGLLSDVVYELAEDRHRLTLTDMSDPRQTR